MSAEQRMPERPRRRRRWVVPVFVAVAVLVYVVVVLLYASSGRFALPSTPELNHNVVTVRMTPSAVNGVGERVVMQAEVIPSDDLLVGGGVTLAKDLSVIITPVDGEQTIDIAKGTIPPTTTVSIVSNGEIENWPLDTYNTPELTVLAFTTEDDVSTPVFTNVLFDGGIPGWNLSGFINEDVDAGTIVQGDQTEKVPVVDMTASRSGSTLAFGVVLLGLMIVMPTLVLFVAITAFRGKRKVEPSFMSWMGAMLFATIPLRTFLPGSPPIGSWIDFLIVLWVIVGLVAGLAIYVSAWMRWGTPAAPRTPPDRRPPLSSP
ncbi:DUF4436 domain-containing protein [Herbiconiux sp. CPCC 205763]|uniref:DUF4436 domain-containing protein n=1 Tax=Herbiconiux aconitum TaxID=2970913 RepID=A0ABT2GSM9_9MICO|nr:DUF4436 domain-containing protein [Herbiconiux aconitum]MCS5718305.1 DUF4436 domain-containing protein [Herbiconiux aconitum]